MNRLRITLIALATFALPAFASAAMLGANMTMSASTTVSTGGTATDASRIATAKARADQEITRRINNLNQLSSRIGQMVKLSASEIVSLQASISAQISTLQTLEVTINADTVLATLKTDIQSITKSYRIYMLILPQGRIAAAGDRVETIVSQMQLLGSKLQARISADTGSNASMLQGIYTDFTAKVADANTQASAAISETVNLEPDNGNATIEASNTAALKDARNKLQAATADLKAAAGDVATIIKGLKGTGSASATASSSASVQ